MFVKRMKLQRLFEIFTNIQNTHSIINDYKSMIDDDDDWWLPTAQRVARRTSWPAWGTCSRSSPLSSGPETNPNLENSKLHQEHWKELYLGMEEARTVHHKEKEVTRLEPKE